MKRRNRGRKAAPKPGAPVNEILTLSEVADYLHCHYSTIWRLVHSGGLPGFQLGSDWRFRRGDIKKWIARQATGANEPGRKGRYKVHPSGTRAPQQAKDPKV
jgi:excisionase family DNA binding protein